MATLHKIGRRGLPGIALVLFTAVLAGAVLAPVVLATAGGPQVSITSPVDGLATGGDTIQVSVDFRASANSTGKANGPTGNVSTVVLLANGEEVGVHENPPQMKEGTHTFDVDLSSHGDSVIVLQVCAYQGNLRAGNVECSSSTSLVIDRTAPALTGDHQSAP